MFQTLINAWKTKEIRQKLMFTLLLLIIYRLGCFIPLPGVNAHEVARLMEDNAAMNFLNLFSGNALRNYSIFALGITPYINGSIIINLLTIAIPALERLSKQEDGPKKIEKITRIVGVGMGLVEAVGITLGLGSSIMLDTSWVSYATIFIVMTGGTAFLMWLGERITEVGIGNGISLLIFTSIISGLPGSALDLITRTFSGSGSMDWALIPGMILVVAIVLIGVTFVDLGVRRVPVQYAKRVVGRKMYGGQSTHIPMKVNASGVMPLIFAMTFMQLPGMLSQFWPQSGFAAWWIGNMNSATWLYNVVFTLLIIAFAYFYSSISFNPIQIAKDMQQYGGFVPGIRPGKPTSDFLARISSRLVLFGALFLAVLALVPNLITILLGTQTAFGATSILIVVSVALETTNQLESQMLMRHYKGFLK